MEGLTDSAGSHLDERAGSNVKNGEVVVVFPRCCVPAIAKSQLQGDIRFHPETILGEPVVRRGQNAVRRRSRKSERGRGIAKEVGDARESKDRGIESEIVVVNAAHLAAER